jgi:hypothetical protein
MCRQNSESLHPRLANKRSADLLFKVRGFLLRFLVEPQTYKLGLRYLAEGR